MSHLTRLMTLTAKWLLPVMLLRAVRVHISHIAQSEQVCKSGAHDVCDVCDVCSGWTPLNVNNIYRFCFDRSVYLQVLGLHPVVGVNVKGN